MCIYMYVYHYYNYLQLCFLHNFMFSYIHMYTVYKYILYIILLLIANFIYIYYIYNIFEYVVSKMYTPTTYMCQIDIYRYYAHT